MNYKRLFSNISYRGRVLSVKSDFHILEGPDDYVVVSTNYGYKIVSKKAVRFMQNKLGGKQAITTKEALQRCSGSMYFQDRFAVLDALYVLVGTQQAKITRVGTRNSLYFNVWKPR